MSKPAGESSSSQWETRRILPLLASATEIVQALGLGPFQVGRSHECDFPSSVLSLPVCTRPAIAVDGSSSEIDRLVRQRVSSSLSVALSVYDVDSARIAELRPTHIITQTQCKVCAVSLDDVTAAFEREIGLDAAIVVTEPYTVSDIFEDIRRIAKACDASDAGAALISTLQARMEAVVEVAKGARGKRPRVAAIEWLEPLMPAGNWVPELVAMAGGENVFGVAGKHSPYMTWRELVEADPDVIVCLPCGFDLIRTRDEMHWLADRPEWHELKAVRNGRVFVADGNQYFNRPGPRIVDSLELLGEMLHPELFASRGSGYETFARG